jgi:N-acetylglutamate synthase-like GNAT family acetyltransferase
MAIHPHYQRHGFGFQLLQYACDRIDEIGCPAFVMASPAGVRLNQKFGFSSVGKVESAEGTFTSMIREGQSSKQQEKVMDQDQQVGRVPEFHYAMSTTKSGVRSVLQE